MGLNDFTSPRQIKRGRVRDERDAAVGQKSVRAGASSTFLSLLSVVQLRLRKSASRKLFGNFGCGKMATATLNGIMWLLLAAAAKAVVTENVAFTSNQMLSDEDADIGNWTVGNCILAQFAMEITLHPNKPNPNATTVIEVPRHAQVDEIASNCNENGNTTQDLSLFWTDRELNSTNVLMRNLTLRFGRKNETGYGIRQAWGTFQLAYFDYNERDTHDVPKLMFEVPFHYSYLCGDVGKWQFYSELDYNFTTTTPNIMLNNATVSAKHFRFDAFRGYDKPHPLVYRPPMDCAYQPNDVVPVAVGVTLA